MSVIGLAVGVVLIVVGFDGLVLPMLPGMPLVLAGAVAIGAADGFTRVGYLSIVPKKVVHAIFNSSKKPMTFPAILSPAKAKGPS
jgi:uncharacterized protein